MTGGITERRGPAPSSVLCIGASSSPLTTDEQPNWQWVLGQHDEVRSDGETANRNS
jgi:hypothetical protein